MKKNILGIIMAVFIFIAILPQQVFGTGNDTPVKLENGESATIEAKLSNASEEKVSSIQFSIKVTAKDGSQADNNVLEKIEELTFSPDETLASKVKICDQRYHKDTGVLDIYIAGTEPIFESENKLNAGTVTAKYKDNLKEDVYIKVEEDSFKAVKGIGLETVTGEEDVVNILTAQQPVKPEEPDNTEKPDNPDKPQEPTAPVIDKSRLQSALEIAEGINQSDYTAESFAVLKKAIESGRLIMNDSNATSEEVEHSADEILNAVGTLVPVSVTSADKNVTVDNKKPQDNGAKTGDWTSVRVLVIMFCVSLTVVAGVVIWKKYCKYSDKTV